MKQYELFDNLYRMPILICVGGTKAKALTALLKHLKVETDEPNPFGDGWDAACIVWKGDGLVLWFKNKRTITHHPGIVAHECLHATNYILQDRGVEPANELNDEHYCYHLQWLVEELYDSVLSP